MTAKAPRAMAIAPNMKRRVFLRASSVSVICMVLLRLSNSEDEAHTINEKGRRGQTVRCPDELPASDDDSIGHASSVIPSPSAALRAGSVEGPGRAGGST